MGVSHRRLGLLVAGLLTISLVPAATATPTVDALDVALDHVSANAAALGVTSADVGDMFVTSQYTSAHNGVTHVNLNQRHEGLEVFGGHATVTVAKNGRVVFAGGALTSLATVDAAASQEVSVTEAVEAAADALDLDEPEALRVIGRTSSEIVVSDGGISEASIPARLGWQPTAKGLRLAWQLTIDTSSEAHLWNVTVDAETGELLDQTDWTIHETAEAIESMPRGSRRPAPTGHLANNWPVPPTTVSDGSSYRVIRVPNESPLDGPHQMVSSPADGLASPYGWHDTSGSLADGPEFTITRGNNVHAYMDQDSNNNPDFGETSGGPTLTFDYAAPFGQHSQNYRDAAVVNLFYGCNIFHDITYRYGFTEPAGNFQANNYGRGGGQGDYVRCEAADGGGTNNANFSTPAADSGTPRMQMYLWPGNQFGSQNQVEVPGVGTFNAIWGRIGRAPTKDGITGPIINAGTGCALGDYSANPGGTWLAVVTGNNATCNNTVKATMAESAGAAGLIYAHTASGAAPVITGTLTTARPEIPLVSITLADGNTIRTAIAGGPTSGTIRQHPNHPGVIDGDFDHGIIFHEYGHGLSLRLTGGPGINCLSGNEQAGEGWSDYVAMTFTLDPDLDVADGTRGLVPYTLFANDRQGATLRPRPYSRNMEIQPFTYDSIKTNGWLLNNAGNPTSLALPHGLGHGWNAVLWDMTWDLVDKHGFNPNVYQPWNTGGNNRSIQYVIDGLKMQGCGPGLVVARNAIIAAGNLLGGGTPGVDAQGRTIAVDGEDTCTLWASFARRGLGYSAVQGTTNRDDNSEAFDTHPDCRRGFLTPVHLPFGQLNVMTAGDVKPLRFVNDGAPTGLNLLAKNSPFSRKVDCGTLQVPSIGAGVTPREYPINTSSPGNSGLTKNTQGVYHYNWLTDASWAGTCREVVVTRKDGKQHRAFFQFVAAAETTGG